jgi:predicted anti-sigma-YlaC factor YlaD
MHCLESARLLSERRDHPLPLAKRIGLRLHLLLCALCRTYEKQISAVCGISHHAGAEPSSHAPQLPPDRKQAIQNALRRE